MNRKWSIVIFVVAILYAAIFAVVLSVAMFLPSMVYDRADLIAGNADSSANKVNYRMKTQDGITTINCGKMTGMDTIWKYQADEEMTLKMYYNLEVTNGKAKLVLITPDDRIVILTEQDSAADKDHAKQEAETTGYIGKDIPATESIAELNLEKGENRVRIVCEKGTAFSLSFRIADETASRNSSDIFTVTAFHIKFAGDGKKILTTTNNNATMYEYAA